MREILFRGKRTDNGEWIEGSLIISDEQYYIVPEFGVKSIDDLHCSKSQKQIMVFAFEVIPETVGQYTGLTDKNGKKIFEGDIVKYSIYPPGKFDIREIGYAHGRFDMKDAECALCISSMDGVDEYQLEVIGNIHDNPELLESGD